MWPPTATPGRCARVTMTAAFQRFQDRNLRSRTSSPGKYGSSCTPIVFTYGVLRSAGIATFRSRARLSMFSRTYRARGPPLSSMSPSMDSTHSEVSSGSTSGTWLSRPLMSGPRSSFEATSAPRLSTRGPVGPGAHLGPPSCAPRSGALAAGG